MDQDGLLKKKKLSLSLKRRHHSITSKITRSQEIFDQKQNNNSTTGSTIAVAKGDNICQVESKTDIVDAATAIDINGGIIQKNGSKSITAASPTVIELSDTTMDDNEEDNSDIDDIDEWWNDPQVNNSILALSSEPNNSNCNASMISVEEDNILDETERLLLLSMTEEDLMNDLDDFAIATPPPLAESYNSSTACPKASMTKKKPIVGENVFAESCVKAWASSRIKAWEQRYLNPENYYFRFVDPGDGQQNGAWSRKEHELFMERYQEWISHGWKIGTSWGMFSKAIPHRVGYQCMNYYRKLVANNRLQDESYDIVDGKLKHAIGKGRTATVDIPNTELGPEWQSDEAKEIEKNVDEWLKLYHQRTGRPHAQTVSRPKSVPKVIKRKSAENKIAKMVGNQHLHKRPAFIDDGDNQNDDFIMMETIEPEQSQMQHRDWEMDWKERLDAFKSFMRPYLNKETRHRHWVAKQEWRRGLSTTEMILKRATLELQKSLAADLDASSLPSSSPRHQASLSRFFTGVKKVKVDTPDELLLHTRIPTEFFSGVKQITPLSDQTLDILNDTYYEVNDMMECSDYLEQRLRVEEQCSQSQIEGLLVDPPWEFILEDGRNDGSCSWNLGQVRELITRILQWMSAGIIFIWTHKLIQADVVRMMRSLDCKYVENLVWFKKSVNNTALDQPSPYISSTKEILLMFKKGDGFELRHQRSPDVIIDYEAPASHWIDEEYTEPKPTAIFDMIETLLPRAGYDEQIKRGRFVELWAKRASARRRGWVSFHQRKYPTDNHDLFMTSASSSSSS